MGENADIIINIGVEKEACPIDRLRWHRDCDFGGGDALAGALMKLRKFEEKDFAKYHPGGSLGKKATFKWKT